MISSNGGKQLDEIQELEPAINGHDIRNQTCLYIGTSQRILLDENGANRHKTKLVDIVKAFPSKYMKFGSSPSVKLRQFAEERDEISRSVPSTDQSSPRHHHVPFVRDINWTYVRVLCKDWIRNPMNMALFAWIACVAISGAILFLVMTGMLNHVLPRKSQRDTWFEVNNQILNALFTLMCLYQHPKRFYYLVLLCRWRPEDVLKLRKIYCKNGTYKPHEWMHMMVVVALLHLNCFAQYALCGLNLGYSRSERPPIGVGLCISVAICAPAFASVYNILSPLGKEYELQIDQEAGSAIAFTDGNKLKSFEKRYSFIVREDRRVAESKPEWVGGLFDLWDDISLAYLSMFCSCCLFGWNMDRLGFGNMYVHIVTFLLFCMAPFFIFNLAALNINNDAVREALGITGIVLCVFGLLYGGFWRIQMRKRFNLPSYTFCCGDPSTTDCFQWLCCCSCSLAQEVRTVDYYDVVEDKLFTKQMNDCADLGFSPSPLEGRLPIRKTSPSSPYNGEPSPSHFEVGNLPSSTPGRSPGDYAPNRKLSVVDEDSSTKDEDSTMEPPITSVILRGDPAP